ncbi:copper resistance protein B [soil metagenome]
MRILLILPLLGLGTAANAQEHHGDHVEMAMPPVQESATQSAPAVPLDHAADALYDPTDMARARAALSHETGGMGASMLLVERLEARPGPRGGVYAWEAEGWTGGDIDRLMINTQGEGGFRGTTEQAEVQMLWSHALDPWFNLNMGVRQDFRPEPMRTHAVIGVEGLAPYWFHVRGALFLSHKGDVTARAEISYDQRITQRLIVQPAAELNLSAQDAPEIRLGSGATSIELGLRLRYEVAREIAPYMGLHWERRRGDTARQARRVGEMEDGLRFVAGVRFWF